MKHNSICFVCTGLLITCSLSPLYRSRALLCCPAAVWNQRLLFLHKELTQRTHTHTHTLTLNDHSVQPNQISRNSLLAVCGVSVISKCHTHASAFCHHTKRGNKVKSNNSATFPVGTQASNASWYVYNITVNNRLHRCLRPLSSLLFEVMYPVAR